MHLASLTDLCHVHIMLGGQWNCLTYPTLHLPRPYKHTLVYTIGISDFSLKHPKFVKNPQFALPQTPEQLSTWQGSSKCFVMSISYGITYGVYGSESKDTADVSGVQDARPLYKQDQQWDANFIRLKTKTIQKSLNELKRCRNEVLCFCGVGGLIVHTSSWVLQLLLNLLFG